MARTLSWSDVRGGAIASAVIVIAAFAVLRYARIGELHGDTFRLHVNVGEARGLLDGSEVWLSGKKIGKVTSIRFRPPSSDSTERIGIDMQILEKYRSAIRRDAVAQIRSGGSLIGAPVVYMSPGTPGAQPLQRGDTLRARPQVDAEGAAGQFAGATKDLPFIIDNVKLLTAELKGANGTVGAFMNTDASQSSVAQARTRAGRLMAAMNGPGTIGRVRSGDAQAAMARAMARVDSLRALLTSDQTSYGRFRRDSTLINNVADIRNELSIVRTMLDTPTGTAGRALRDSAITQSLASAEHEMTLLLADMKKRPLRYIKF